MAKIVLGLSGGVDSSVAAYLLKEQGHEVIAVFMRNWDSFTNNDILGNKEIDQSICPQEKDWQDAQKVAAQLNIEIHRVDFIEEYYNNVFQDLINQYSLGRTPNPDILCNKYIKFGSFLKYVKEKFNPDFIATGHYAKTKNGLLYRAIDQSKDQSYFLAQLNSEQLSKTIFPLGEIKKTQVREIAKKLNLITAEKKDSTGICFIGERNFANFLQNYIPAQPGKVIDIQSNKIIGDHIGIMYYTLGQRKGLNLGGNAEPYYVAGRDLKNKILYVAPASNKIYLYSDKLIAIDFNKIYKDYNPNNLSAKFRYRQEDIKVELIEYEDHIEVLYPQGFEAVSPGQQIVIYDGDICVGGAVIDSTYYKNQLNKYH